MEHHLMKTLVDNWSYEDVWGLSDERSNHRADVAAARPPRRRRRGSLSFRRRTHLRPAAGAA